LTERLHEEDGCDHSGTMPGWSESERSAVSSQGTIKQPTPT
jgi:hypothetical protein